MPSLLPYSAGSRRSWTERPAWAVPARELPKADPSWLAALGGLGELALAASILEPAVAVVWQECFASVLGVQLPMTHRLLLVAPLWMVYVADHWLDYAELRNIRTSTRRHRLLARHRQAALGVWLLTATVTAYFAWHALSIAEWLSAGGVGLAAALYLAGIHRRRGPTRRRSMLPSKELFVALIFGAGTTMFVWPNAAFDIWVATANASFVAVALLNLVGVGVVERSLDDGSGLGAVVGSIAPVRRGALWLLSFNLLALALCPPERAGPFGFVACSALLMVGILATSTRRPPERNHALLDIALLTPLCTLLLTGSH